MRALSYRGGMRGCAALACVAASVHPAQSRADTWGATPELSFAGTYSDNPQLRVDTPRAGEAVTLRIGTVLDWKDDTHHLEIAPRGRFGASGGDSALAASAYHLDAAGEMAWELSTLSASAQFGYDSAAVQQPDAGTLIRSDVRVHDAAETLSWRRQLTERTSLEVSAAFQRHAYGRRPEVGLTDFRYRSIDAQFSRRLSERLSLAVIASRSHYEIPERMFRQESTFQQGGIFGSLDPLWSYKVMVGRSRISPVAFGQRSTGTVYVASLSRSGERVSATTSINRSLQPSGFGMMTEARELNARLSWALSERKATYFAWRQVQSGSDFGSLTLASRKYTSLAAGLSWQVAEHWDLGLELNRAHGGLTSSLGGTSALATGTGGAVSVARHFARVRL
jgi:hypothetical protein